jgi:hypothetical protein
LFEALVNLHLIDWTRRWFSLVDVSLHCRTLGYSLIILNLRRL